ncbi:hypothetical protein B0H13DRAFT_1872667 [Mycena leptocephala]|nr:hypothetical protein B0H13DRAFT_1872667 [Mycena leptocephala]
MQRQPDSIALQSSGQVLQRTMATTAVIGFTTSHYSHYSKNQGLLMTSIPLEHTATRNSGINAGTAETAKEQIKRTTGNSQRAMRAQTNKRLGTTSKKLGTAKGYWEQPTGNWEQPMGNWEQPTGNWEQPTGN